MNDGFQRREAELQQGPISYREAGEGAPVVFVHGLLVDGHLWDGVAAELSSSRRCILPDWPMGSHRRAMRPDADLSPPGMADLIDSFLAELSLEDVTLVGNDSGGAICQVLVTRKPERVGRLVLTNCDCYDNFPPKPFGFLPRVATVPGVMAAMVAPMRFEAARRAAFRPFSRTAVDAEVLEGWTTPARTDAGVRRDAARFLGGMNKRHTLEAATRFVEFGKPVLVAWAPEDRVFPVKYGERLARDFTDARLERIPDARTFVPVDQPARVASLVEGFAASG
ncbi:MAG TPA: alpha/beta hydrolase [Solirubrobacterales bacterium]|nr:alpha/beta hydrolase [Solirubrobacterales bacterium]